MQLPDGRQCPYFYVNSHRRTAGETRCNLLADTPDVNKWTVDLCQTCRIPEIRQANACPTMILTLKVQRPGWRFWLRPKVIVNAHCTRSGKPVKDPMVGCGLCHTQYEFIVGAEEDTIKEGVWIALR